MQPKYFTSGETPLKESVTPNPALSLEQGFSGDALINIGTLYPEHDARIIFCHYRELLDEIPALAENFSLAFEEGFYGDILDGTHPGISAHTLQTSLERRAGALLDNATQHIGDTPPPPASYFVETIDAEIRTQQQLLKSIGRTIELLRPLVQEIQDGVWQARTTSADAAFQSAKYIASTQKHNEIALSNALDHLLETRGALAMETLHRGEPLSQKAIDHLIETCANNPNLSQLLEKLYRVNALYTHLRRKFEDVVYGRESAVLAPDTVRGWRGAVTALQPELFPSADRPPYFPVGISAEFEKWAHVQNGELMATKPIDLYAYLFWLNNQNIPIEIIVCDTIQTTNYLAERAHLSPQTARDHALAIGEKERQYYQKIIDTFGLSHLRVLSYEHFLKNTDGRYESYKSLCTKLSNIPPFQNLFLEAVQTSRAQNDRERHVTYVIDEVAWTLAHHGTKIGHVNEARYDAISLIIETLETLDPTCFDTPPPEISLVGKVATSLQKALAHRKSTLPKDSSSYEYTERMSHFLFGKNRPLEEVRRTYSHTPPHELQPIRNILQQGILDAYVPAAVASSSFGYRHAGVNQEGSLKFREPYSTYFTDSPQSVFLDSDQVVALPEGFLSGKILTLPASKQQEYAKKVIRPLILHFFKTLENAPASYFTLIGKNREELFVLCEKSETLSDLLSFVQEYIVKPSYQ